MLGDGQLRAAAAAVHALVSQVVNGEQGRRIQPAPVHVGGRQAGWPVVGVHQLRLPVDHAFTRRDLGGRQPQTGKADVVVGPVATIVGTIGCAVALVEFGADQHIDHQAVGQVHAADLAGWQGCMAAKFADDVDRVVAFHHLRITGNQHPHVMQVPQRPWQRGGDIAQTAGLDQVGDLRGDEQDLALVGVVLALGAGCLACRGEIRGKRLAVVRVE
ncbi:hypothetical protein D3C79_529720 [compost metagenome]